MPRSNLLVAIGDIHGRFERVETWLRELEQRHGRPLDAALGVGDLETFAAPEAPLRKRTKRVEPAEFGPYARGEKQLPCPLYFIAGNNEDFAALHGLQQGGELAPGVKYLGRAGMAEIAGLRVGFLSGILAPTSLQRPLEAPLNLELARRAGHYRQSELEAVADLGKVDLLLLHDWPRGVATRGPRGDHKPPPPFWGSLPGRQLVDALRPAWVLCGHHHMAWAATLGPSRVACLDETERPEASLFWMEVERGKVARAGWGLGAEPAWRAGEPWDPTHLPKRSG